MRNPITDPLILKKIYGDILNTTDDRSTKEVADHVLYGDVYDDNELDRIDKESKISWKDIYDTVIHLQDYGYLIVKKSSIRYYRPLKVTFKGLWHYHLLEHMPEIPL
jgi:hypothetical protein